MEIELGRMEYVPCDVRRIIWRYYFDARRQEMEPYLTAHKAFMENSLLVIRAIPYYDDYDSFEYHKSMAAVHGCFETS